MDKKNSHQKVKILNSYVSSIKITEIFRKISNWIKNKEHKYICVSAVHASVLAYQNIKFSKAYNGADIVVPDGRPLYWLLKYLGYKNSEHLRGEYLTRKIIKFSAKKKYEIGFFGGKKKSLVKCVQILKKENKNLIISFSLSPPSPFSNLLKRKNKNLIKKINSSKTKILFVALGCPIQELWMAKYQKDLNCICIGIGAAVDFISGEKVKAPLWIQKLGLEWFLRLASEPKRLFWRYFSTNFLFLFFLFLQFFKLKKIN